MLKFLFKSLTTIIIGIILGWYLANSQLPIKLTRELNNTNFKTVKILFNSDNKTK